MTEVANTAVPRSVVASGAFERVTNEGYMKVMRAMLIDVGRGNRR
jgi:hypothetical protein